MKNYLLVSVAIIANIYLFVDLFGYYRNAYLVFTGYLINLLFLIYVIFSKSKKV